MSAPLISVILPVHNGEAFLSEALDSVFAQTHRPLEVIVVDDGSTDGTPQVLDRYGDRIVRIRQSNRGPGGARNVGLATATADLIAFMDADDVMHPEKLARQVARLEANPAAGMCHGYVQNFWIDELQHEQQRLSHWAMAGPQLGYLLTSILARRSVFDRVGGFDERLPVADDTDWFIRASEQGIVMEPMHEVVLYRRIHRTNITRVRADTMKDDLTEVVKAALNRRRRAKAQSE